MDRGANLDIQNKVSYYAIVNFYFNSFVFEQYGQTALDIGRLMVTHGNKEIHIIISMIFKVNYCA